MKIARIPVSTLPPGLPGFVRWVKFAHPQMYRGVANRLAVMNQLQGFGLLDPGKDPVVAAVEKPGIGQQILTTFKELVPVALTTYQQQKLFDLQIKRAAQNLPPLDTSAIADASALRVGVDSGTRNTGLMIAGVFALGLIGFAILRRS